MKNSDKPATASVFTLGRGNSAETTINTGLTKREHFAGLAMQAYITGCLAWSDGLDGGSVSPAFEEAALEAVGYADALLKELNNENN